MTKLFSRVGWVCLVIVVFASAPVCSQDMTVTGRVALAAPVKPGEQRSRKRRGMAGARGHLIGSQFAGCGSLSAPAAGAKEQKFPASLTGCAGWLGSGVSQP